MLLGGRVSAAEGPIATQATGELRSLLEQLAKAPRPRDFKTVPMILDTPDFWDAEALDAIIAYRGGMKQVWDNTEIGSPWLNLMRNSLNAQVFSFRHPDFLEVSATHGSAPPAAPSRPCSNAASCSWPATTRSGNRPRSCWRKVSTRTGGRMRRLLPS
jgi:hypothetical protein